MFANHYPSARSRADYSACLSFRTSLENHGTLARNARRRNADARCGDYHILCHTQKTRRRGNPRPRFGTGIIRRTRSRFYLILFFLSFCFLFFDGNDKYYRRDNNHPNASGQYYDDFGHLSERRLVPFGIFRRAKEKREIAVGQFFKTRLVNPASVCDSSYGTNPKGNRHLVSTIRFVGLWKVFSAVTMPRLPYSCMGIKRSAE